MKSEEVRKIAELARVALTDAEIEKLKSQFGDILTHIKKMDSLSLEGVEPVNHPFKITNVFREDKIVDSKVQTDIIDNAPAHDRNMIQVPQIIEGKS
jgi:aspartyl-tRNA(Asn)/glutamyl-tRNA(Gln) amidotransferase subunit C